MKEKRFKDKLSKHSEFRGCKYPFLGYRIDLVESSIGMNKTRTSLIGRRLFETSTIDEKDLPFASKPGFTFGISTRT